MLVLHLEYRRVLRPGLAMIVHPRRADIGMTEQFLHFGDVGTGIERVSGVQVTGGADALHGFP